MIGTNDLSKGISTDSIVKNIFLISSYLKQESPATKIFVQSILPVNNVFGKFNGHTGNGEKINFVNEQLKKMPALLVTHLLIYILFLRMNKEGLNQSLPMMGCI